MIKLMWIQKCWEKVRSIPLNPLKLPCKKRNDKIKTYKGWWKMVCLTAMLWPIYRQVILPSWAWLTWRIRPKKITNLWPRSMTKRLKKDNSETKKGEDKHFRLLRCSARNDQKLFSTSIRTSLNSSYLNSSHRSHLKYCQKMAVKSLWNL